MNFSSIFDFDRKIFRDALRLGLQSAIAATLCFLVLQLQGSEEKFVGVLSAVLIVQPSIGSTVTAGWERLLSTLVGSAIGLFCLFLLPNAYSVIVALAVVMFVMNFIAGFRPGWRYGVVAAVALALADTSGNFDVAKARAIAIGIGITAGVIVSLVVWPESAARRARRYRRLSLCAAAKRFKWAIMDESDPSESNEARHRFHKSLSAGRDLADASSGEEKKVLQDSFDTVEALYNSIILINRVESPMSLFNPETISRDCLIEDGQAAICSLLDEGEDFDVAYERFCKAIDAIENDLTGHDLENEETKGAASVVFALQEMVQCLEDVRADKRTRDMRSVSASAKIAARELIPS